MTSSEFRHEAGGMVPRLADLSSLKKQLLLIDGANPSDTARRLASLLAAGGEFYQQDGGVVRISLTEAGERIEKIGPDHVVLATHDICQPVTERRDQFGSYLERVVLPTNVARFYLHLNEGRGLRPLRGICRAPLLSDDGKISWARGYDQTTGLWCTGIDGAHVP